MFDFSTFDFSTFEQAAGTGSDTTPLGDTILSNHKVGGGTQSHSFTKDRFLKLREEWREEALEAQRAAAKRASEVKKAADRKKAVQAAAEAKEAIEAAQSQASVAELVRNLDAMAGAVRLAEAFELARLVHLEAMRVLAEQEDEEEALLLLMH